MKRSILFSALVAGIGLGTVFGSHAYAVGGSQGPANTWNENPYYSGFGGPLPPGIVEGSAGFSTIGDYDGRTIGLAGVTTNISGSDPVGGLTTINTGLFSGTDVNLYEISVTSPSTFTASIPSTGLLLTLFSSTGTALAASVGGVADTLNSTNDGITAPGLYYIGLADNTTAGLFPSDNAGNLLFSIPQTGATYTPGVYAPVAGTALSTNPLQAWATATGAPLSTLLVNTSFVAGGSTITLTGADFAQIPEPASLSLISVGVIGLLGRRRRQSIAK
jgi:hypothetical protein